MEEEEWAEMGDMNTAQSANRADQHDTLRLKMKWKSAIYQERTAKQFRKMKCQECELEFRGENQINTVNRRGKFK